jgi:hypothetical protein
VFVVILCFLGVAIAYSSVTIFGFIDDLGLVVGVFPSTKLDLLQALKSY